MACCDWETFEEGFLKCWRVAGWPEVLIDWHGAREDWNKRHMTGGESAFLQQNNLRAEGEYLMVKP